jgi:hypothetical protein
MTNPETYGWQTVCVRATLEKDDLLITERLYEAMRYIRYRTETPKSG